MSRPYLKGAARDRMREQVAERYLEDTEVTMVELADEFDLGRLTIKALLLEAGVTLRDQAAQIEAARVRREQENQALRDQGWYLEDNRMGSRRAANAKHGVFGW